MTINAQDIIEDMQRTSNKSVGTFKSMQIFFPLFDRDKYDTIVSSIAKDYMDRSIHDELMSSINMNTIDSNNHIISSFNEEYSIPANIQPHDTNLSVYSHLYGAYNGLSHGLVGRNQLVLIGYSPNEKICLPIHEEWVIRTSLSGNKMNEMVGGNMKSATITDRDDIGESRVKEFILLYIRLEDASLNECYQWTKWNLPARID